MNAKATSSKDAWYPPVPQQTDRTSQTDDQRIKDVTPLPPPEHLIRFFPIAGTAIEKLIGNTRSAIRHIMQGKDDRLLVVMGPCSIHDPAAALDYARRLKAQRDKYADRLEIVMRVYFEKPRTTVGWKGLINDPYLDESYRIDEGLRIARQLLIDINRLGLPAGSEFLDVISPQYIGDLIAWGAIGARTTESQVHRELASGLSMAVGFKNGTDGSLATAINAMRAAAMPHRFVGINQAGQVWIRVIDYGEGVTQSLRSALLTRPSPFSSKQLGERGGLGLLIVRRILQLHDSDIEWADTPGGGTTFSFSLPTH